MVTKLLKVTQEIAHLKNNGMVNIGLKLNYFKKNQIKFIFRDEVINSYYC